MFHLEWDDIFQKASKFFIKLLCVFIVQWLLLSLKNMLLLEQFGREISCWSAGVLFFNFSKLRVKFLNVSEQCQKQKVFLVAPFLQKKRSIKMFFFQDKRTGRFLQVSIRCFRGIADKYVCVGSNLRMDNYHLIFPKLNKTKSF